MTPEERRELLKQVGISTLASVIANLVTTYFIFRWLDRYLERRG